MKDKTDKHINDQVYGLDNFKNFQQYQFEIFEKLSKLFELRIII